ncbi:hypothetical protein P1P75_01125 [Streptomyces sp. ID05-39B]|uniref:hypothetical protein n=1 Tax=Streptomyces sp. ID05-39B TaxID=3028664 RepID=UPI0029A0FB71|nr:hypothetical protein [Streptomyces sp. ID05-39B]MDX3525090.1 hypothetical protein [Streptomyces sp. ID05-39B]
MEILAGQWWQNLDVWTLVVTAIVALGVGWLTAWATLRASNPKYKLGWWEQSNTPLFAESRWAGQSSPLSVRLGSTHLEKPRIVDLVITNLGKRDITAAKFHEGAPLRFSFGHPVLVILDYESQPAAGLSQLIGTYTDIGSGSAAPPVSGIELRPTLLRKGQRVTITVLVDGDREATRCIDFPLVDVDEVLEAPSAVAREIGMGVLAGVTRSLPFPFR